MAPSKSTSVALGLLTPLEAMPGIGPKRARALADRGITTLADALLHLPSRYQDWRVRTTEDSIACGNLWLPKHC